jgi:hypothetical protein
MTTHASGSAFLAPVLVSNENCRLGGRLFLPFPDDLFFVLLPAIQPRTPPFAGSRLVLLDLDPAGRRVRLTITGAPGPPAGGGRPGGGGPPPGQLWGGGGGGPPGPPRI